MVREYTHTYGSEVAGLVLAEIVSENQLIPMGPHAGRIGEDTKGLDIPKPHEDMNGSSSAPPESGQAHPAAPIEPPYDRLPAREQQLHVWASALPSLEDAENSQREWSGEYFAKWVTQSQAGSLGARPLVVLTRAHGGYGDTLDKPAAEVERVRLDAQRALAALSSAGTQQIIDAGHNLHLEAPEAVAGAIQQVVSAVRNSKKRDTIASGSYPGGTD